MSKQENHLVTLLAVTGTAFMVGGFLWLLGGILGEGLWFLAKNESESIPELRDANNLELEKLTILGDTFSGYSTFRSPEFQQALQDVGLSLVYRDEFNQNKRAELLNEGEADLLVTSLDQFLKQKPNGKIIGLIDRTVGADAIILNNRKYPELKSLSDLEPLLRQARLKGEQLSISYAKDTPSEYLLALVVSTKFDAFKISDFQIKAVADASETWELLHNRKENLAMAVMWEPYVTQAKQQGYTVVLSSQDAPKAIIDTIVASDSSLKSQPEKIAKFLEAYYHRLDVNVRQPSSLQEQIAKDAKLSANEAVAVLQGIDFFTSLEARNWMSDGTLKERIASTAAVLVLTGKMSNIPLNIQELYTSKFIERAASNTEALINIVQNSNPELAKRLAGKGTTIVVNDRSSADRVVSAPDISNSKIDKHVQFEAGSAVLTAENHQTLDWIAEQIKEFNEQTVAVRILGHCSKHGSEANDKNLSEQRAKVVVEALRDRGLKHQLLAEGKNFHLPLSGIHPEDPRQQRTEISLVRIN